MESAALSFLDGNVDVPANGLKEVLLSTVQEGLGKQRKKFQSWVTNKVLNLCNRDMSYNS